MQAVCPRYEVIRFPASNRIPVPICQTGAFALSDEPPGSILAPGAQFSATPTTGTAPLPVTFTDQSSNSPTEWLWDFGDGWTSPEQHPSHVYNVPGIYTVALSVSNPAGSDTETKPNHVTASGLLAAFSATTVQGTAPLTVSFTDQSAGIPGLTGWAWDFGDGGTSSEHHPEYTYTTTGTYTVTLTISNTVGSDTLSLPGYITVREGERIYLPLVVRNSR